VENRKRLAAAAISATMTVLAGATTATGVTVAEWRMNEPHGARVMHDTAGPHNGTVRQRGIPTGGAFHWSTKCGDCKDVTRSRVVAVADSLALDIPNPGRSYTVGFRFKTTTPGNLIQKGQAATRGGAIKVQVSHGGLLECVFRGANGTKVKTTSLRRKNDGKWHTARCIHYPHAVAEFIDGRRVARTGGTTGRVNNSMPLTIGGKIACDQVRVSCEYYRGWMDWVRISRG
jgi:hypothetical protein